MSEMSCEMESESTYEDLMGLQRHLMMENTLYGESYDRTLDYYQELTVHEDVQGFLFDELKHDG